MADKVKIKLKQKVINNRVGRNSRISVSQRDKKKLKVSLPVKVTVTMKQNYNKSNNSPQNRPLSGETRTTTMHQGGHIKIKEV